MVIITKIHNKYYNIEGFKHPGGNDAIWHSYGRDATAMFEMYHPFVRPDNLQCILQKYEVSAEEAKPYLLAGEDDVPQFEYNTDFSKEIKRDVINYFKEEADKNKTTLRKITKATTNRWLLIGALNVLRASSVVWWLSGSVYGLFISPVFTWIAAVNTFHDANHFSLSDNWKINRFFGYFAMFYYTPLVWYHEHNISHHSYTNVKDKDVDIYHANNIIRLSPYSPYKYIYKFQYFMVVIQYLLVNIGVEIHTSVYTLFGKYYFNIIPQYNNIYDRIEIIDKSIFLIYFICRYILLYFWFNDIYFLLLPVFIQNSLFAFNSQITHLHHDSFQNEKDWYKHQVLTSSNHSIGSTFGYIFSGGLNYQIEHHLFPGVNHCHLPYIQPIVEKICVKHGVSYKKFNGYYDAFCSYYKHIVSLSYDENEDDDAKNV
jgi:fatty acid desaturase